MARIDVSRSVVLRKAAAFDREFVSGVTMTNGDRSYNCTAMAIPSIRRMLIQSVTESAGIGGISWEFHGDIAYADFTFAVPVEYAPNTSFGFVGNVTVRSNGHNIWPGTINLNSAGSSPDIVARVVRLQGSANTADASIYQVAVEYGY